MLFNFTTRSFHRSAISVSALFLPRCAFDAPHHGQHFSTLHMAAPDTRCPMKVGRRARNREIGPSFRTGVPMHVRARCWPVPFDESFHARHFSTLHMPLLHPRWPMKAGRRGRNAEITPSLRAGVPMHVRARCSPVPFDESFHARHFLPRHLPAPTARRPGRPGVQSTLPGCLCRSVRSFSLSPRLVMFIALGRLALTRHNIFIALGRLALTRHNIFIALGSPLRLTHPS